MKIIYRNDWNIKERINYMLDLNKIDYNCIEYDPMGLFIPITDKALQMAVCGLAEDIAKWNDWCYPDIEQTKMSLYIPMSLYSPDFEPAFQIEMQPPKWTLDEVDDMFLTQEMVYAAMDFHNGNDSMCETLKVYDAEFTTEEVKQIAWIIISHLEDIINKLESEKRKTAA